MVHFTSQYYISSLGPKEILNDQLLDIANLEEEVVTNANVNEQNKDIETGIISFVDQEAALIIL